MKYIEYSYYVEAPIDSAFGHVIDLKALHENAQIFAHGILDSDETKPEETGKKYTLSMQTGGNKIETTLRVVKIEIPTRIHVHYEYKFYDAAGGETDISIFPWESMDCFIHFSDHGDITKVKTIMIANGVKSVTQKILTRIFAIINWFQQRKINKRVKSYIEKNA